MALRSNTKARDFAARPLLVTGILAEGRTVEGLVIASAREVRDFLVPDGTRASAGWSDLICCECGEGAGWCPDLSAALPSWVAGELRSDSEAAVALVHADGLVAFA